MILSEALEEFIEYQQMMCHSAATIRNYKDFLGMFIRWSGDIDVSFIDYDLVKKYNLSISRRSLSKATVGTYMRHLKAFIGWLLSSGYLSDQQLHGRIRVVKSPKKVLRIYTADEIKLIFSNVPGSGWILTRNMLLISLMLDSGLRRSELTRIKMSDLHIPDNMILVRGKGEKDRYVPVGSLTSRLIRKYFNECPHSGKTLFYTRNGAPLSNNAVKMMMSDLKQLLGFEISAHKLRHNFATNYVIDQYEHVGNIDIYRLMYILGHEDISTTRRYLHIAQQYIATKSHISHLDLFDIDV